MRRSTRQLRRNERTAGSERMVETHSIRSHSRESSLTDSHAKLELADC
jgi:hypothetical protein